MPYPSVHTKLVILLGTPLAHSHSAMMHNRVFKKLGMDYCYLPVEVSAENLSIVFAGLIRMNVAGFNVTIPHKIRIMRLLDEIDPLAAAIGAVNTICLEEGRTRGYNTDGQGFLRSLAQTLNISVSGKRVFILGCGGAARAIAMTLAYNGVQRIYLCNRTQSKAGALAEAITDNVGELVIVVPQTDAHMADALQNCDLLINTTSVGMHPAIHENPIKPQLLRKNLAVADIVYNPRMTRLLETAHKKGCPVVDGLGMLVYQGAEAFTLWTGQRPLVKEMFAALEESNRDKSLSEK